MCPAPDRTREFEATGRAIPPKKSAISSEKVGTILEPRYTTLQRTLDDTGKGDLVAQTPRLAACRSIRTLFGAGTTVGLNDGQLLERFTTRNGEAAETAFAALVERHGPMVLRVCRSVLGNSDDAHDAFQAAFLVLATRAESIRSRDSIGSWIHGVALRTARRSRAASIRRRLHERRCGEDRPLEYSIRNAPENLALDELDRLPERLRVPLTLCDLDDLTHEQAARLLRLPVGTIKSRLARGRAKLRERLVRLGLSPGSCLSLLPVLRPPTLSTKTVDSLARSAAEFAEGSISAGNISASIRFLTQGVRYMMLKDALRTGMNATVGLVVLAVGAMFAAEPSPKPAPVAAGASEEPQVVFETRFLEMENPDWRKTLGSKLKPVAGRGGLWTVDRESFRQLVQLSKQTVQAPRVTTFEDASATISAEHVRGFATGGAWVTIPALSFKPKTTKVREGIVSETRAKRQGAGFLVYAKVTERWVADVKTVVVPCSDRSIQAVLQIPHAEQIDREEEWSIPDGEVLVLWTARRPASRVEPNEIVIPWLGIRFRIPRELVSKNVAMLDSLVAVEAMTLDAARLRRTDQVPTKPSPSPVPTDLIPDASKPLLAPGPGTALAGPRNRAD